MERDLYHGINSKKLLGLRVRCDERDCTGWAESTGFLRFSKDSTPDHAWVIEYECPTCKTVALVRARDSLPLVRDVLRPIFQDLRRPRAKRS